MTPETTAPPGQTCRHCGGCAAADAHFCPQCSRLLSLGRPADYFTFLGVPRKLNLDSSELDRRYRELSRQLHPDYFHNRDAAERRASLARSSYLNDAYRTLRQPASRLAYLLEIEGTSAPGSVGPAPADAEVPATLLEEVFALNEELDAVRNEPARGAPEPQWRARLEQARAPIDAKRSRHEAELRQLSAKWDELVDRAAGDRERQEVLSTLRHRIVERNYIVNLLAGIERELAQP